LEVGSQANQINRVLHNFNNLNSKLRFPIENDKLFRPHYHKPIRTIRLEILSQRNLYIIIPNDSCHSFEHKKSVINYLIDRIDNYPTPPTGKAEELIIIKDT
jgi:hypothetical protein